MPKDTRKIKPFVEKLLSLQLTKAESIEMREAVLTWGNMINWLREQTDPEKVLKCLAYEFTVHMRPIVLDRIRTRYNKLRAEEELNDLEEHTGQVINVNISRLQRKEQDV